MPPPDSSETYIHSHFPVRFAVLPIELGAQGLKIRMQISYSRLLMRLGGGGGRGKGRVGARASKHHKSLLSFSIYLFLDSVFS